MALRRQIEDREAAESEARRRPARRPRRRCRPARGARSAPIMRAACAQLVRACAARAQEASKSTHDLVLRHLALIFRRLICRVDRLLLPEDGVRDCGCDAQGSGGCQVEVVVVGARRSARAPASDRSARRRASRATPAARASSSAISFAVTSMRVVGRDLFAPRLSAPPCHICAGFLRRAASLSNHDCRTTSTRSGMRLRSRIALREMHARNGFEHRRRGPASSRE